MTLAELSPHSVPKPDAWDALRRLSRPLLKKGEACELCGLELPSEHSHLVEIAKSRLLCACEACAILFDAAEGSRFRRVPRPALRLAEDVITDQQWNSLGLPIGLAFFFRSTPAAKTVCFYPSAGGAIEAQLPAELWEQLFGRSAWLRRLSPDTTALLVNRLNDARDHFIAPIDACYRLIGLVRTHWRGFSGGTAVWQEIDRFFAALNDASTSMRK